MTTNYGVSFHKPNLRKKEEKENQELPGKKKLQLAAARVRPDFHIAVTHFLL